MLPACCDKKGVYIPNSTNVELTKKYCYEVLVPKQMRLLKCYNALYKRVSRGTSVTVGSPPTLSPLLLLSTSSDISAQETREK